MAWGTKKHTSEITQNNCCFRFLSALTAAMPLGSRPPNAPGAVPGCWRQDQKSTQTNGIFIWIPFFGGDLFGHAHPSSSTWAHANLLQWARGRRSAGRGCAVLVLEQWHPHSLSLSLSPSPLGSAAWRIRNESRTFGPQSVWTAVSLDRGRLDRGQFGPRSVWTAVTHCRAVQNDRGPNCRAVQTSAVQTS